jgi:hypothetical protein
MEHQQQPGADPANLESTTTYNASVKFKRLMDNESMLYFRNIIEKNWLKYLYKIKLL